MCRADRYLEYGDKYWIGSTGVGKSSGHLHHQVTHGDGDTCATCCDVMQGGSTCPEHVATGGWEIARRDEAGSWSWVSDPRLQVTCVEEAGDGGDGGDVPDTVRGHPGHPPPYMLPYRQPRPGENNIKMVTIFYYTPHSPDKGGSYSGVAVAVFGLVSLVDIVDNI